MPDRHQECDLRPWLDRSPGWVSSYTAARIAASYERLEHLLGPCSDLSPEAAFDIGSGAGHETFALGTHFGRVLGIDTRRRSIREARRICRHAGISTVAFERADAERWRPEASFSFVLCNLMSHYGRSRIRLLDQVRATFAPGGWMHYSEETEGYAPRDIEEAIERRDALQLRTRLGQVLRSLAGESGFRFFLAGSADAQLARLGLEVTHRERQSWGPLVAVEAMWCRATGEPRPAPAADTDPDYVELDPDFGAVRRHFRTFIGRRTRRGFSEADGREIETLAGDPESRLAPFLLFLLMTEAVPLSRGGDVSRLASLMEKAPVVPGPADPDWDRVQELNAIFADLVRGRAQRSGTPEAST